jgi:hypothetical protein
MAMGQEAMGTTDFKLLFVLNSIDRRIIGVSNDWTIWATYPYSSIFHPVKWNCSLTEMKRRAMFRPIFAVKSSNRSNHIKGLVRKFILSMCAVFVSYMESIL